MQLAGDPPALRFLGLEQPAGQGPQLALALPQALLRPPPVRPFTSSPTISRAWATQREIDADDPPL